MSSLFQDIRYSARMLLRTPGMTVAAVLTLALGIGANTAVFTVVNQTLVNPVSGLDRSRTFVELGILDADRGLLDMSSPDYRDYRDHNEVFTGLVAFGFFPMNITDSETQARIWPLLVSGNYFDVLGVRAAYGRTFIPADDASGGQAVVVISHGLWQRQFGGRPDTLGKTIRLNGHAVTIIGITPPDFHGTLPGLSLDAWLPLALQNQFSGWQRSEGRDFRWLWAVGWLKPGVSQAQAQTRLNLIAQELARGYPQKPFESPGRTVCFWPFATKPLDPVRTAPQNRNGIDDSAPAHRLR